MKIGWATDLHLEFVHPPQFAAFVKQVNEADLDWLIITGDISNARQLQEHLLKLATALDPTISFVLGNHDFYGSSFAKMDSQISSNWASEVGLNYVNKSTWTLLDEQTWFVGLDGWADGTAGLSSQSTIQLNDYFQIDEFIGLGIEARFDLLRKRGEENAWLARDLLSRVIEEDAERIIFVTHVPPFAEAAWHEGKISDSNWVPHFSAPMVGEVLLELAKAEPDRDFIVLCGHTHGAGVFRPIPNLVVYTGGAEYGKPVLQAVIEDGEIKDPAEDLRRALAEG